jgi:hypothetical protein
MVNGQARRDGYYLQQKAEHHWNSILGRPHNSGLVNNCTQYGSDHIVIDKHKGDYQDKLE